MKVKPRITELSDSRVATFAITICLMWLFVFGQTTFASNSIYCIGGVPQSTRNLRAVNTTFQRGQVGEMRVELDSLGDENSISFSLNYDTRYLTFLEAVLGNDASGVTLLPPNTSQVSGGRVGLALAHSPGQSFQAGTRVILFVRFSVSSVNNFSNTSVSFGDQPVPRLIADPFVNQLNTNYISATISVSGGSSNSLTYSGKQADRVGKSEFAISPDGALDGGFVVNFASTFAAATVTRLTLTRTGGGVWDTVSGNGSWVLGVADSIGSNTLRNQSNGSIFFTVSGGSSFAIFASDNDGLFSLGSSFTLTILFSNGLGLSLQTTITTIGLPPTSSFNGKVSDRVGRGEFAIGADGSDDGAFTVTFPAGSGARNITGLSLSRQGGGSWDTTPGNGLWVLGVADSLNASTLRNSSDGRVNFTVQDGGSFAIFASDNGGLFSLGNQFTLSITLVDRSTISAMTTITLQGSPPAVTFLGLQYDRVGRGDAALSPDGSADGAFSVKFPAGSGSKMIVEAVLVRTGGGTWDTIPGNGLWVLGFADSETSTILRNGTNGVINNTISDGGSFVIFAADNGGLFAPGKEFTLTLKFSDSSTLVSLTTTASSGVIPNFTFSGKQQDRVGKGETALSGDGLSDGVFLINFPTGSGAKTIVRLSLTRSGGGAWDTITGNGLWVIGVADAVNSPTLKNSGDGSVNFTVQDGGGFIIFVSDNDGLFDTNRAFTLTISFNDGSSAVVTTTIVSTISPPTIVFNGRQLDRVGRSDNAISPDGSPDGAFTVTFANGSGVRTITQLSLSRTGGGAWDSIPGNGLWVLGVADTLNSTSLRNTSNGSVNFTVQDGGSFVLFASDNNNLFSVGASFQLTITFSDQSTVTSQVSVTTGG